MKTKRVSKGIYYWRNFYLARAFSQKHNILTASINLFGLGWTVQESRGGKFIGPVDSAGITGIKNSHRSAARVSNLSPSSFIVEVTP